MAGNYAYMIKEGEAIKRVPLNEWGRYRRSGWAFSTEEEWQAQQAGAANVVKDVPAPVTKKKKKKKVMRR